MRPNTRCPTTRKYCFQTSWTSSFDLAAVEGLASLRDGRLDLCIPVWPREASAPGRMKSRPGFRPSVLPPSTLAYCSIRAAPSPRARPPTPAGLADHAAPEPGAGLLVCGAHGPGCGGGGAGWDQPQGGRPKKTDTNVSVSKAQIDREVAARLPTTGTGVPVSTSGTPRGRSTSAEAPRQTRTRTWRVKRRAAAGLPFDLWGGDHQAHDVTVLVPLPFHVGPDDAIHRTSAAP